MANEYDDLVEVLTWLLTKRVEPKFQFTRGLLGDGNGNVDVPDRDGFSYVRPDRNSNKVFEMFNKQAFAADGTPILIGELPWQPGLQQVLGIDWDTYLTVGWANRFAGIAQHGDTHVWRDGFIGEDPFSIYRRQIFDLRCEPLGSGTTSVLVTPYGVNDTGVFKSWPGSPGIDLSAAIPSATGTIRNALVYWDFSGDTLYGTLGISTGTLTTVTETSIPSKPVEPQGTIPSAFVELQGGQNQIKEEHIKDARPLFVPYPGGDGVKVSKIYDSDFENEALTSDADGNLTLNGTGTFTIPSDIIHAGDPDTKVGFANDAVEITVGGLSMFKLENTTQDLLTLGPGSGDVDIDFNGDMFLEGSSGNLSIGTSVNSGERFSVQGATGQPLSIAFFTGDGDGTDNANFVIYGVGTPGSVANRERLLFGYNVPAGAFRFQSEAQGTGTLRPLVLETEGNTNQLHLDTSGNVGMSVTPSTRLDIGAGAMEFEEMTAPGAGAANTCRLYIEDNGAGKTRLMAIFATGAAQQIAIQP